MELPTRKALSLEAVREIVAAARAYGASQGHNASIVVVVDDGAHLLFLEREDGIPHGTVEVATLKAQISARFGVPSKNFRDAVDEGLVGLVGLPGMAAFEGAIPLLLDGQCLGAIAVSGIDEAMDGAMSQAGADRLVELAGG
ncbi:MAG TPA: heme-binding protein, partial [Acidimicrobiales bacterium]